MRAVGQPDSTRESGESRRREAERGQILKLLLCKVISKKKHWPYAEVEKTMETKLERISQLSRENPDMVFTSIGHLINKELLRECHEKMDGKKAVGIDGETKEEYSVHLEENLEMLERRIKNKSYKPKPARKVEIPKEDGKTRPLSIYCYEDKLVQEALRRVLEAVFEPHFYDEMMGFRPRRGCHQALRLLNTYIEKRYTGYVLDADIKSFFNNIDHEWAVKFIESKIKDPNVIRLVRRMLKAGIMEDYQFSATEAGSGQGSVCSPIIANIYMHYVLVWWFKEKIQPNAKGFCGLVVYADDFVACFQHKWEAERFYGRMKKRMGYFGLELQEDKSRLIKFGRFAGQDAKEKGRKAETFDFLGFTHYCSTNKSGKFRVKRKTSRKKFKKKCKEMWGYIRANRHMPTDMLIRKLNEVLVGYDHYYGITDNYASLQKFHFNIRKFLFYWLNRRSQRKSYTWEGFRDFMKAKPLVAPKIYVSIYA